MENLEKCEIEAYLQTKLELVWKIPKPNGIWFGFCFPHKFDTKGFQTKLGLVWKILTTFLESLFQPNLDLVWKKDTV